MKHTLKLHGVIIGHSDLEEIDPGTQRAHGRFRPGLGYDLIQPIFRLYRDAVPQPGQTPDPVKLQRYHDARDALELQLVDADGVRIPTSAIHIADYSSESEPERLELDVLIPDAAYWERRGGV